MLPDHCAIKLGSMRTFICSFILLFIGVFPVISQSIAEDEIDEFTGIRKIITKPWEGNSPKKSDRIDYDGDMYCQMKYYQQKDSTELYFITFYLWTDVDFGCLSKHQGKAIILFENGNTMDIAQSSDTNCKRGLYHASYYLVSRDQTKSEVWRDIMLENLEVLKSQPIKAIRVYGSEGYHDFQVRIEKRNIIADHANLIIDRI